MSEFGHRAATQRIDAEKIDQLLRDLTGLWISEAADDETAHQLSQREPDYQS